MKRQLLTPLAFIVTLSLLLPLIAAPVAATVKPDVADASMSPLPIPPSPAPPAAPNSQTRSDETTILPYGSVQFRYRIVSPSGLPSGYQNPGYDDSQWPSGNAAFGSGGGCQIQQSVRTNWPIFTEIAVRKLFYLPPNTMNVRIWIAVDNNFQLFVNGHDVSGGIVSHENCPLHDDFVFQIPQTYLNTGNNLLAVRGIDHGVESFLDVKITAELGTAPQGSLRLTAAAAYNLTQPIAPTVRVDNPTGAANTYTVTVSLLQNGAPLDSQARGVTVPGGGSVTVSNINFGPRPAGRYRLRAELRQGSALLSAQEFETGVLASEDQARALRWVDLLTTWTHREFKEGADLVVDTNVDSLSRMGSELANYLFGKLLTEWIGTLGRAMGMGNDAINGAASTIDKKLLGFKELIAASYQQLRPMAQQKVDDYLSPERQQVASKQQATADYLREHDFPWPEGFAVTLRVHGDAILNVVETEPIPRGILPPPRFIGTSTLSGQRASWEFYDLYGRVWSALALAAAVAVILIAVFASAGTLAGAIPGLAALRGNAGLIAVGVTGLLGLIAIGMDINFEQVVAPAITRQHATAMDLFQAAGGMTTGASFHVETNVTQLTGRQVAVATTIKNIAIKEAQPLAETYIYSPDGRVVRIISAWPTLQPGQQTLLQDQTILPRGTYKVVSAVHTRDRFGLISQVQPFEVTGPQVQIGVGLADAQLSPGEALHAVIFITNTNSLSSTGDVAVIATATDEQNFSTWVVNLGPGTSQRLEYSFVPQTAGSYLLQVNATDGSELLARWDAAYLVGDGAGLALNYSARNVYDPNVTVTIPITAANAGNLPTATVLSLVTLDRLHDLAAIYTDTHALNVNAGGSVTVAATALSAALAQPGLYTARLFLSNTLYTSLDFAVAAQDTLFADIYPDTIFHAVSDTVTLTVQVMNSVYTYTDATVSVALWRPDGLTQTVAVTATGTGQYQGMVTAPVTGTYLATVDVSKPNYRAVGNSTFFVAGDHSQLLPTFDGRPILGTTQSVTVTVHNEHGLAVPGAGLVISGTGEYLSCQTDGAGQVALQLAPSVTQPYQVNLEKMGFAQTMMDLSVWIAPDTTPPALFLDAPSITNQTPLTVTGLTEVGITVTVNALSVTVDAQGRFTTMLTLSEGTNILTATATDVASNTATITRSVTLDTVPPTLTVTYPPNALITNNEVISVTGSTEVSASLTVSGTLATVNPTSGAFNAWALLHPGVNLLPIVAADAAGNTTTVTRSVVYKAVVADFAAWLTSGVAPLTVAFTNTSTGDFAVSLWAFGDGVTSTLPGPTHTYMAGGVYTVALAVSGPGGIDTLTRTDYITAYMPVRADFTAWPTSGVAPLTVAFTNTSTGDFTASLWDLSDGITTTLPSPTHTYAVGGVYTVTLSVSGPGGTDAESKAAFITVTDQYKVYLPLVLRQY